MSGFHILKLNVISAMEDSRWKDKSVRKRTMTGICNVTSKNIEKNWECSVRFLQAENLECIKGNGLAVEMKQIKAGTCICTVNQMVPLSSVTL